LGHLPHNEPLIAETNDGVEAHNYIKGFRLQRPNMKIGGLIAGATRTSQLPEVVRPFAGEFDGGG
jgi:hypothetical protein